MLVQCYLALLAYASFYLWDMNSLTGWRWAAFSRRLQQAVLRFGPVERHIATFPFVNSYPCTSGEKVRAQALRAAHATNKHKEAARCHRQITSFLHHASSLLVLFDCMCASLTRIHHSVNYYGQIQKLVPFANNTGIQVAPKVDLEPACRTMLKSHTAYKLILRKPAAPQRNLAHSEQPWYP
jgi:hypothetical protein